MKKILAIALALVMVLAMVACGEKPLRPSVTVTGLEIDYIPSTSVAVDSLYQQQLDLRIFADEFLRAAIPADSL